MGHRTVHLRQALAGVMMGIHGLLSRNPALFRISVCEYFVCSSVDPGQTGRQRLKTNLPTLSNPTRSPAEKISFEEQANIKANIIIWISDFAQIESKFETKYCSRLFVPSYRLLLYRFEVVHCQSCVSVEIRLKFWVDTSFFWTPSFQVR